MKDLWQATEDEIQEMRRQTNLKVSTVCFLALLTMSILGNFLLLASSFPSYRLVNTTGSIRDHTANNTLFMQKFQRWYDYVHYRYDADNIALDHANLTADEYSNALSRWTLAWHPLLLTLAYEKTGDKKYLMEAKFFVDSLWDTTSAPEHTLTITPRNGLGGLLDADIPMIWAMQKLNEFFGQTYGVTAWYTYLKSQALYNNSTDLAWASPWNGGSGVTFDEELMTISLLAYLTNKGVGSYTSDCEKIYHYAERYRVSNFYPYGDAIAGARPDLTLICMIYYMIAYHYLPSIFNTANLQATLDQYGKTNSNWLLEASYVGLGAMADVSLWKGFTLNERLRTALLQATTNFHVNNLVMADLVCQGERQPVVSMQLLLLSLAFSERTSPPSYSYGGFRNYPSHGATYVYQVNSTIQYNQTDAWGTVAWLKSGVRLGQLWGGIAWDYDAFAYNYTYGYYRGYKNGEGSLSGNDVTVGIWENYKRLQMNHTNINTNQAYPDNLAYQYDSVHSPCYLVFVNGTIYSLTSGSTRTISGSNPLAWYEPQVGYLMFYKILDNSTTTMEWKITVSGDARGLSAAATKFEIIPWFVPARTPTDAAVTNKVKELLSAYNSGQDMVARDFRYSTSSEGSIKWKLEQFSDITVYTDKNMTSSSYDGSSLTFTINADAGEISTTKVYVGSHTDPRSVIGATSWSYDPAAKIITVSILHSSPAGILIFW